MACGQQGSASSLDAFSVALDTQSASELAQYEELPRYELTLVLDPDSSSLSGRATIQYTNVADAELREVYLRLYPNMEMYAGQMATSRAVVDGREVPYVETAKGTDLKVPLPQTLAPHRSATIVIDYTLSYPAAMDEYDFFGTSEGVTLLPECYPVLAPLIGGEWRLDTSPGYGDAAFADTSLYRVQVTAPSGHTVIAPGVRTERQTSGDSEITTYVSGPTRTVGLVVVDGYDRQEMESGGVTYVGYSRPEDSSTMLAALGHGAAVVAYCEENLAPYSSNRLTLVQVPVDQSSLHMGGMVLLDQAFFDESRTEVAQAVALGVAREWWGERVCSDPLRDPWIDESLAVYTAYLYLRTVEGAAGTEAMVESWQEAYADAVLTQPSSLSQSLSAYSNSARYEALIDSQGPLFWRDLELLLGESGLLAVMRELQQTAAYGHLDTPTLVQELARLAGPPGTELAADWGLTQP